MRCFAISISNENCLTNIIIKKKAKIVNRGEKSTSLFSKSKK